MGILDFFKKKSVDDLNINMSDPNMGMNSDLGMDTTGINDMGMQSSLANNSGFDSGMSQPNTVNLSTMGMNSMNNMPNQGQSAGFQQFSGQGSGNVEKDMQIISLKLDAIKSELDSISQRVKNIENIAEKEQQTGPQQKRWY